MKSRILMVLMTVVLLSILLFSGVSAGKNKRNPRLTPPMEYPATIEAGPVYEGCGKVPCPLPPIEPGI